MTSNVYFFQHTTLPLVKIGKADDWAIRALQVGGVELIDFERSMFKEVSDSTTAYDLERMLHVLFEDRRVPDPTGLSGGTEWFCETVMGEVRRLVRGLTTTNGERVGRAVRVQIPRLLDVDVNTLHLDELILLIFNHCDVVSWVKSHTLWMWKASRLIKPHMGDVTKRLAVLTDCHGYRLQSEQVTRSTKMQGWAVDGHWEMKAKIGSSIERVRHLISRPSTQP